MRFHGSSHAIGIRKCAAQVDSSVVEDATFIEWDMAFTTRPQYLRASLTRTYGCEIIFVGSGGMIDYPNREQAEHNLQDELAVMIRQHEAPLAPRPAAPNPLLAAAKRAVKRAMGRVEVDLYDLRAWTVWAAPRAVSEPPRVEQANGQVQLTACRLSFRS